MVAPDAPAVVFLGDSLTAGYGLDPDQAYPALIQRKIDEAGLRYRVVNAGVSGETSAGARRRIEWLLAQPVAVLVVETGGNDGLRGQDPSATAENIQVPLELRGEEAAARARADELLARVGLEGRGHHYPAQLSGGEQQRVALARAFSHRPAVLFADEPTGNLDAATGATVIGLMSELNRELGTTLVLVTHDPDLAARARRIIRLADGAVVHDSAAA